MARGPRFGVIALAASAACGGGQVGAESGGSSGGGASSGGETSSSTGSASVACHSSYSNVAVGTCDLLQQNCPDGKTCTVTIGSDPPSTGCAAALGFAIAGEPCADADACAAKLACVFGHCAPVCCPDSDQPCNGGVCKGQIGFQSGGWARVCFYPQKDAGTGDAPMD